MYVIGRGLYPLMELHLNVDDWGTPPGYIYLLFKNLKRFIMSETILDIVFRENKTGVNKGKMQVLVTTEVRQHWLSLALWNSKGLSNNLEAFKFGSINVDYFQAGDKMLDGTIYEVRPRTLADGTKVDGTDFIVRDFNATQNVEVIAMAIAAENERVAKKNALANALFMRNRQPRVTNTSVDETPVANTNVVETPAELELIQQLKDAMVPQEEIDAHISGGTLAEAVAELQTAD